MVAIEVTRQPPMLVTIDNATVTQPGHLPWPLPKLVTAARRLHLDFKSASEGTDEKRIETHALNVARRKP